MLERFAALIVEPLFFLSCFVVGPILGLSALIVAAGSRIAVLRRRLILIWAIGGAVTGASPFGFLMAAGWYSWIGLFPPLLAGALYGWAFGFAIAKVCAHRLAAPRGGL